MEYLEFAKRIKTKYPQYADLDDFDLAQKMVAKFPTQYADVVFPKDAMGRPIAKAEVIREQYPSEKIFGPITEGVAQAGGQLLKAAKATPMGIGIAGVVGQGLEIGRQATQAAFGEPIAPQSFGESLGRQAKAFAGGVAGEGVGRGIFKLGGKVFGPAQLTPNQTTIKEIADKYNVPMTPADIKGTKLASLLESISEKSLVAGSVIQKFRQGQLKAFDRVITDLVSKTGNKLTREQAGAMATEVMEARASLAKQKTDALYQAARESVKDQYQAFVKNDNVNNIARQMVEEEKFFGPELKSKIIPIAKEITENKTNFTTLEGITALRSKLKELKDVEDMASKIPGRTTPVGRKLTILLNGVEKDFDDYYKNVNPEAKGLYDLAKASYKEEIGRFGSKEVRYIAKNNPEKIVDYVIKPNNVTAITNVKKALGESGFAPIKQRFLLDIVESTKTSEFGATPAFRPSAMANMLNKYEPETLSAIFSKSELKEIGEIAKLSSALQTAERVAGNPSGTGQILSGAAFMSQIATNPVITAMGIGIPTIMAYAMTSPMGRKIMIEGLSAKPGSKELAKAVTRFATFSSVAAMKDRPKVEKK